MTLTFSRLDPVGYHRDTLPDLLRERGAAAAHDLAGVPPLTMVIDGNRFTYRAGGATVAVEATAGPLGGGAVVEMTGEAWSDLVQQLRTVPALQIAGALHYGAGGFGDFARWEPALRCIYAGVPIYEPGAARLVDRAGDPLDLTATFTLNDDADAMAWFFARTGYLHVRRVFTAGEVAALNAEVDRLAALARPGDDESWWATDAAGNDVLCRLVYAGLRSEIIAALDTDPRVEQLLALTGFAVRATPDRNEGHSVLLKSPGELRGLANIPWHTDCGLGGHPVMCPSAAIGIQLTAANAAAGRIEVVPGSHGQTCRYGVTAGLGAAPVVGLDTEPGDITMHVADVMHASPPPSGPGGRRVLYATFANPTLFDFVGAGEAINDLVRNRTLAAGDLVRHHR